MSLKYRKRSGKTQALVGGRWRVWSHYLKGVRSKKLTKRTRTTKSKETFTEKENFDYLKSPMIGAFDKFKKREHGEGNFQITNALERKLNEETVNYEGDGWYQLGSYASKGDYRVKIRYNPLQSKIEIWMSGRRYA